MAGKVSDLSLNQHGLAKICLPLQPFLEFFCGGFHQKDLKVHTFMVFFGKMLLQCCILHKNFSTEARIHQKSAVGKSADRFTLVSLHVQLMDKNFYSTEPAFPTLL